MAIWPIEFEDASICSGKLVQQKSVEFLGLVDIMRNVAVFDFAQNFTRTLIRDDHIERLFNAVKRK